MKSFSRPFALLTVLTLLMVGCGGAKVETPEVVPVAGVILNGGKPVADAIVAFSTTASPRIASGKTDSEGKFVLMTFAEGDGAVPGEHVVTVIKLDPALQQKPDEPADAYTTRVLGKDPGKSLLPQRFASPINSPFKATVKAGERNDFSFDLAQ